MCHGETKKLSKTALPWTNEKYLNIFKTAETCQSYTLYLCIQVIPPKEWVPRKSGYNLEDIMNIKIPDPISQVINGNRGIFQSINVRKKKTTLREFHKMANSPQYRTPGFVDYEDLERKYWKNLTFVAPVYGADVPGSITDPDCQVCEP